MSKYFQNIKSSKIVAGYVRAVTWFFIKLPIELIGIPVVAIAVATLPKDKDCDLPKWAWPWGNAIDLDGDEYWKVKHYPNNTHRKWWPRFQWFALRNRVHNFSYKFSGLDTSKVVAYYESGNSDVSNLRVSYRHWHGSEGTFRAIVVTDEGKVYPMYSKIKRWMSDDRCLRILIGWNISRDEYKKLPMIESKFAINPFMSFEKKTDEMDCC